VTPKQLIATHHLLELNPERQIAYQERKNHKKEKRERKRASKSKVTQRKTKTKRRAVFIITNWFPSYLVLST
jgi:preprotein translocase subunit Sec63